VPVLALNLHAGFECRHSGACCTAGWPIPVEGDIADAIREHGVLPGAALETAGRLPEGAVAVLAPLSGGACPAFDGPGGNLCSIQRTLGHGRLPAACRHFPRVALLEPDAVRVTLSHFCPTAASMLFAGGTEPIATVADAPGISDRLEHDGFDARRTIPPFLRPGVAMDPGSCRLWERCLLDTFGRSAGTPETMLAGVAITAEAVRGWTARGEPLESRTAREADRAASRDSCGARWTMTFAGASHLFQLTANAVPPGLAKPLLPADGAEADSAWVLPGWAAFSRPLGRYLAARAFAGWSAYLGKGIRTQVAALAAALAVVRVEAARAAARAARPLDDRMLLAAIRAADLLLHHHADMSTLVKSLAGVEKGPERTFLEAIGFEVPG
jgi:Fe-S-cluster containining protein